MRFSLKNGLLGIGVFGAVVGLLGRLWHRNPELLLQLVSWLPLVVFALALFLRIRYHKLIQQRPELWLATTLLLICCVPLAISLRPDLGTKGKQDRLKWLSTSYLVNRRLGTDIADHAVWEELEQRVLRSRVATGELEPAFEKLLAYWKANAHSSESIPRAPYHVSRSDILHRLARRDLISNDLLKQIADLRFGQPEVRSVRLREGRAQVDLDIIKYKRRLLRVHYFSPWVLVWDVEDARLDDKSLAIKHEDAWSHGNVSFEATPGDHELTLDLICGYISVDEIANSALDPGNPYAFGGGRAEYRRWPKPKATWNASLKVPIEVYRESEEVISLVTDEKRSIRV